MVLDAGEVVEFDSPQKLLENTQGFFAKLVNEAGLVFENFNRIKTE
jgi:ABC-type multidrug transport system fused ATPase/permease subunit